MNGPDRLLQRARESRDRALQDDRRRLSVRSRLLSAPPRRPRMRLRVFVVPAALAVAAAAAIVIVCYLGNALP